jgi:plastocyanin
MRNLRSSPLPLAAAIVAASLLAGCGGGSALGFPSAPPALDPASPVITAANIAFDSETIEAPAGKPFILVFENRENLPHNVSMYEDAALQKRRFEGVIFNGPGTRWYPVPALAAGTYVFICDVHPDMRGFVEAR